MTFLALLTASRMLTAMSRKGKATQNISGLALLICHPDQERTANSRGKDRFDIRW